MHGCCGGGMRGCSGGACMLGEACVVAPGGHAWLLGGHAWLLLGAGGAWLLLGACVVALGGMRGCSGGGCAWLLWGASMVAPGGEWGVRGCSWGGHAWLLWGCVCGIQQDTEIRSMSRQYASYWNAFLLDYSIKD